MYSSQAALVGDLGRAYLPRDRLRPLAAYDVPGLGALEDRDVKRTIVWAPRPYQERAFISPQSIQ